MKKIAKALMLLVSIVALPVQAEVHISRAMMAELIPGQSTGAVFMSFYNATQQDIKLISAKAAWAGSVEIHTHVNDNGVLRMRQIESLTIPANGMQKLQRGGLHLMVFNVQSPLPTKPELTLCFDNGACETVTVKVHAKSDTEHDEHAQHGHHH